MIVETKPPMPGEVLNTTSPEELYRCCCQAGRDVLRGLEARDVAFVEKKLRALRALLACRPAIDPADSGVPRLRLEQLDVLEGIVEEMEARLTTMHQSVRSEFEQMLACRSLLLHLTSPNASWPPVS